MAVKNSLAKRQQKTGLTAFLTKDAVKKQINDVIGGKNGQRFISSIVSAVQVNPALQECTNPSILSAALLGESLRLSPSPQLGHYYMVPFNNKKKNCKEAQFQLGYKGYIQLAIRSGEYRKLNVVDVKEGELVSYDPFNEEIIVEPIADPDARELADTIGYYAMFETNNGYRKAMYWSKEKMMAHADKYSMAFSRKTYQDIMDGKIPERDMWKYSSFWYKNFDGMAFKTMLRQLISKWGIMSIDMQSAMTSDMAVLHQDGTKDYVETPDMEEADYYEPSPSPPEEPGEPDPAIVEEPSPQEDPEAPAAQEFFS